MDLSMIAVGIIGSRELTEDVLAEVMARLSQIAPDEPAAIAEIKKQLEVSIGISMTRGEGLTDGEIAPWVSDIKGSTKWIYWESYARQLKSENRPLSVMRSLDEDTDNILTECGNPSVHDGWRVQGLVMGDVQSGKTGNYCGLISKAGDAGYRVIVLLTGMIEELRSQSQERLDEGFVGADSRELLGGNTGGPRFGAGRFREKTPNVLTSIDADFLTSNRKALRGIPLSNISEPVLLVMKKNKTALENLITYLKSQIPGGQKKLSLPLLLVDDESDNASVNARRDEDPATINRLIRELLDKFSRASYVAYTATPFANVFINPDSQDLFPKNFVYSLNAPSSYIGAGSIFLDGGENERHLVDIADAEAVFPDKHKKVLEVHELPQSLEDAVEVFLLSCAIRDLRAEPLRHRSMLVNVSRFVDVQKQTAEIVNDKLYALVEEVKQYLADEELWRTKPELCRMHKLFLEHYADCGLPWDALRAKLYDSIASVKVLTINQKTNLEERLNYRAYKTSEKGRRVIAVGGQTLSRGLTLEGLCVSYFYRNSKAYDTLLQMGRWFGYRPHYSDLCRVWMAPEAQDWFAHIADVVAELRGDIKRMHANRMKPKEFGIRVRSHPGALLVTAANKMRNSSEVEVDLSFSRRSVSTPVLSRSEADNSANTAIVGKFLMGLGAATQVGNRLLWRRVPSAAIADFIDQLLISPLNSSFIEDVAGEKPLVAFIRSNEIETLEEWDVCLPQGLGDTAPSIQVISPSGEVTGVAMRQRQFERANSKSTSYLRVNKQRVGEIADEKVDLKPDEIEAAEAAWRAENAGNAARTIPGAAYLGFRKRPLLTIHLIEPANSKKTGDAAARIEDIKNIKPKLLPAISLSFPPYEETESTTVAYRLNKVYLQNLGLAEEEDDDDDQD